MLVFKKNAWIFFLFAQAFIVTGCSKKAEEQTFLESYYRAAAKGDAQALDEYFDYSMFKVTNMSDRQEVMWRTQVLIKKMNELSNANGELKKVTITKIQEIKQKEKLLHLISCDLEFKNGRTVTSKEALSRPGGKLKVYMIKETDTW